MVDVDLTSFPSTLMGIIATIYTLFTATLVLVFQTLPEHVQKIFEIDRNLDHIVSREVDIRKFLKKHKGHIFLTKCLFELLTLFFILFEFYNGILIYLADNYGFEITNFLSLISVMFFIFLVAYIVCVTYFMLDYMISLGYSISLGVLDKEKFIEYLQEMTNRQSWYLNNITGLILCSGSGNIKRFYGRVVSISLICMELVLIYYFLRFTK